MSSLTHKNTTTSGRYIAHAFCKKVQELYGKDAITMNMHLHAHIKSCIEDYGPLHGFWVYAFERYNGILESFSNNNRCIEAQLMERFLSDIAMLSVQLPTEHSESFGQYFTSLQCDTNVGPRKLVRSLADTVFTFSGDFSSRSWKYDDTFMTVPSCRSKYVLSSVQQQLLGELYAKLCGVNSSDIDMPSVCWKYTSITVRGMVLGCHNSRCGSSSIVAAIWRIHQLLKI